ncbi:MAG: carboxy-S-adenosyl-L-methionine synthase CmoA [Campylobacterales bacterium]|nr:carboxy-S-adenosyl-L-methionine synthase CmoA [Campylobacterales bacterium]
MDTVFTRPIEKQFEFDASVASVFDDMAARSIPFYKENLTLIAQLLCAMLKENDTVVDLGCSTANTLLMIHKHTTVPLQLFGFDNAEAMLEIAAQKSHAFGANITLEKADITTLAIPHAQAIVANYTLQFIRPPKRALLVKSICDALTQGGMFVFSEKIVHEDKTLSKAMIDVYLAFKRQQGYSDFEIAQKREALENVLVPYTEQENKEMALKAGFAHVETLFKWGNFATYLAKKA